MNEQELREQIAKEIEAAMQPAISAESIYIYKVGLRVAADIARGHKL